MGGGVSLPSVPLASTYISWLQTRYREECADGASDRELSARLQKHLSALIIFNQADTDHSGEIDIHELQHLLVSLPQHGSVPIRFEEVAMHLKGDGGGENITLEAWLTNLDKLPILRAAIDANIDLHTGKVIGFVSLEDRLERKVTETVNLELTLDEHKDPTAAFATLPAHVRAMLVAQRAEIRELRKKVGSVGNIIFKQVDIDQSGKICRKELIGLLKQLHTNTRLLCRMSELDDAALRLSVDTLMALLDVDGDNLIDLDEWIMRLEGMPIFSAFIEQFIDPVTNEIAGYDPSGRGSRSSRDSTSTGCSQTDFEN